MRLIAAVVVVGVSVCAANAQVKAKPVVAAATTVPVVMLSDIHFDPFHDPVKVQQLRDAKVEEWEGILNAADSGGQATDFTSLERTCRMRGVDTPMPLLMLSLAAEKKQEPQPLFVTVSGDLMAHQFDCRFKALFPKSTEADYSAFASKTVAFLALELHRTFPQAPVYFALGNNDSGCKDYAEDSGSAYLKADAQSFAGDALNATNSAAIAREFSQYGDYDVLLPWPMEHTRLIVLQDIFEARKFTDCDGTPDKNSAAMQIEWLRRELAAARAAHDHVWVMAHIPPGVDAYSTLSHVPAV
jgi:sphingomyelin phosphodiesterase acid-like 3